MEKADGWDFTRGGYTLYQSGEPLQLILAASGSEVSLALKAAHLLEEKGVAVRVVSIPCAEVFYAQDEGYRRSVLPDGLPIMVVEAGVTRGWYSLKPGAQITVYGIDRFGVSGPGDEVAAKLGLTADAVAQHALAFVKSN
jgi:transketolase